MPVTNLSAQTASLEERVKSVLRSVRSISPEVIGAAAVNMDGFILASVLPNELDEELLSAMTASFLGAGEQMSGELMHSPLEQTYVKSEKGYVILNSVGSEAVLAILATSDVKLGLVFFELKRKVLPDLARILAPGPV
jgi:predicted regulator of Ras-like GTPase activity (Roadblock/LC7/MglB family)